MELYDQPESPRLGAIIPGRGLSAHRLAAQERMILDPEVGVADFREALRPQARERMLEGTQL